MTIDGVEVLTVGLTLRKPLHSAGLIHRDRTTIFVRVASEGDSGWGECAAAPTTRSPDPSLFAVERVIEPWTSGWCAAARGAGGPEAARELWRSARGPAERSLAAAFEMALWDLWLRRTGSPLADALGAASCAVESGALVGMPEDRQVDSLLDAVAQALAAGARRIRLKIEPGWDRAPIAAVRQAFPGAMLMADANGSFTASAVDRLRSLDAYGLRVLEQPFPPGDLSLHRELARSMETPIGLDESLGSAELLEHALALGACRVACIKPSRFGGLVGSVEAAALCAAHGVDCFVGGFFETGLGRAANAALAGRPEFTLPGDLGDPDTYLDANPFTSLTQREGLVSLSKLPGLGVEPRAEVLERRTLRRRWFPCSG